MSNPLPRQKQLLSIGDVIAELSSEFPEISISKIRFLESEGLIHPLRAPSGYRKFNHQDLERIRYILELQHHHYLPLRVIKDHLDGIERGVEQPVRVMREERLGEKLSSGSRFDQIVRNQIALDAKLSSAEFSQICRLDSNHLDEMIANGLLIVEQGKLRASQLEVARVLFKLNSLGVPYKHLRATKTSAEREFALVQALTKPLREKKAKQSKQRADETALEILNELSNLAIAYQAAHLRDELS